MLSTLKIGVKHRNKHVGGGERKDDPDRYHHVPERQVNVVIFQSETEHDLSRQLENNGEGVPYLSSHGRQEYVMMVPTVRYHREDEVDEEDGIIQPQGDEHNEPGPTNSLIKSENQKDEEHQTNEPGKKCSV